MEKILSETELMKFKNDQLSNANSELTSDNLKLNRRIEDICYRFLELMDRRSEDIGKFFELFRSGCDLTTLSCHQTTVVRSQLNVLKKH